MGKTFNFKKFPMDVGRITYFIFRVIPGVRVVKMPGYKKIKGGAVIVANHTGFSDPHTVGAAFCGRRVHFMASKEVMNVGIRKYFLRGMGCIPVDRGIFDLECIKKCIGVLKDGYALGMFPQGGISHSDTIDELKAGAALIACRADVPIIPTYIKTNEKRPKRRKVIMGVPINPGEYVSGKRPSNADLETITEQIRLRMTECEKYSK